MIAEIGLFCLLLGLLFALLLVIVPTLGLWRNRVDWMEAASWYVGAQFTCIALAYVLLTLCFLNNDFSLIYVLTNSSVSLPWFYKICAVWGGHEGSMLLWVLILSAWMFAISLFSVSLAQEMRTRVLVVLGILSVGFILFLLSTSNPFSRQFDLLNTQGRDLNPLLQDPGFLFHPPMLYMGYVGFSIAFALAIAALWQGRIEASWAKWTRPWTLAAWCCLTAGITLGSWWAYRELGWGGWWFWDPVENASFMPWLVGTALMHSLAVSEQRQQFKAWTLFLAITAFSLSLIGTFLVRSGVLTSVHAFAVDPKRGLYILCFLLFIIGGSLLLFAFRAQTLKNLNPFAVVSRESALLLGNVFLAVLMLTVLMGTLYPLIIDGLGLGKLSVGAPYFNTVFVPLTIPLFILMGIGTHLNWQKDSVKKMVKRFYKTLLLSILIPSVLLYFLTNTIKWGALLGLTLATWILLATGKLVIIRMRQRASLYLNRAFWGMVVAHSGIAVTIIGISLSSAYSIQDDLRMAPGDIAKLAGYEIRFVGESPLEGANYHGRQAQFDVQHGGSVKRIYPEKRIYNIGQMAMTESAIDAHFFRDIYVALGEPLDGEAWSVRLYVKPFIRWIWGGGFMILLGGLLALVDRRYHQVQQLAHALERAL